jgi:uncharacterized protein
MACLSSRIPYGEPVTPQKLGMIEQAENILRDLGFGDVRVRHHEMKPPAIVTPGSASTASALGTNPPLARIEVGVTELPRLLEENTRERVATALRQIGYGHVTVDLQGYRRGSLNDVLSSRPGK